ncbi:SusC/RagA family TonB-linked outer membrane protein [Maribacter polysaccharolyticus]|uniref:SusC/RagA family TonB-linked outer membrane protein n=1 Tax=Maribacter polysaccharolyticus TaxID=3020831 RepID=UPI00237F8B3D|nr:SusC/RagA family TonB-linked outer membrane protein [Maribacter polysaccharolyticus]MDE3741569.1 SusC/RagA family TonB-linked outer membrane protein [Maribacter polysaccharolyticus]
MKRILSRILMLLMALVVHISFAQEKTISGTVTDQFDMPLPGVNIVVIGTTRGTLTDFDGNYTINASEGESLLFTYVGQKDVTITVGAGSSIDVTMEDDAQALQEVVVTGLGIKRDKKSLGYSQQSVSGEELQKGRQTDINNALAGRVSGVQVVGNSSSTFGNSEIKLRGETGALYVVDGVQVYSISDINMESVEDMSVLKGASATAIYGPNGRNGVIIITTKKAASGKAVFSIDQTTTINAVSAVPDFQNEYGGGYSQTFNTFTYDPTQDPDSWADFDGHLYPDYYADESWGPKLEGQLVRHWDSWLEGSDNFGELREWSPTTSDVKDFYETAITTNTTFAFAKGGEGYNLRTSLSLINQGGIIPNSNRRTVNASINAGYDITEKLSIQTVFNYQDRTTLNNPDQNYGNLGSNFNQWWQRQLSMDRLKEYEQNGTILSWNIGGPRNFQPLYWDSPYFQTDENLRNDYKNNAFGKVGITYEFNEKFSVLGEIRSTFNSYSGNDRGSTKSTLDTPFYEEYQYRNTKEHYFGMATYNDKFSDGDIDLNVALGGELINNDYNYLYATTNGGLSIPGFYNLSGSVDAVTTTTYYEKSKTRGAFIKASVGYKDLLYLDGSYRLDWSSTASADDNRVETFGASASLLAHKLIEPSDAITFAKFRAGYAGAPYFPEPYNITSVYESGDLYQGYGTLSVPDTQSNSSLVGGTRTEFEVGAEFRFVKNRIGFDVTYFNRVDEDLPTSVSLDGSTGYTDITVNSGKTTSNGLEMALSGTILKSDDFSWDLGVNFGTLTKVVDEIYPGVDSYDISTYTTNMKLQARVGEEYGLFYGTGFARHTDGSVILTDTDYYAIQSNKKIGSLLPDFTGGLSTSLKYKNLDLYLGFDGQKGGLYYSRTERYMNHSGLSAITAGLNDLGNPLRDPVASGGGVHVVGVLQTGTDSDGNPTSDGTVVDTYVDAQTYFGSSNLGNIYENNVHDASYFKLRTVKLTYTFNQSLVKKFGLDDAQVSLLGNNVWLIHSDLPWIDPSELEKRDDVNWAEAGTLPMTSSFGLNLKLTF